MCSLLVEYWVLRDQELVREPALPQMSHSYDPLLSLELCHASWRKHHKYRVAWSKVWHLMAVLLDLCLFITASEKSLSICGTVRTNDTVATRYKTWIIELHSWFLEHNLRLCWLVLDRTLISNDFLSIRQQLQFDNRQFIFTLEAFPILVTLVLNQKLLNIIRENA